MHIYLYTPMYLSLSVKQQQVETCEAYKKSRNKSIQGKLDGLYFHIMCQGKKQRNTHATKKRNIGMCYNVPTRETSQEVSIVGSVEIGQRAQPQAGG